MPGMNEDRVSDWKFYGNEIIMNLSHFMTTV